MPGRFLYRARLFVGGVIVFAWAVALIYTAVIAVLLSASPASARRSDASFRRGVQAADRGEWQVVERSMREAIQLDGQENRRKVSITGMRYEWYLPHYFLGLALLRQGELENARAAWAKSRAQGVVLNWRDAAQFTREWSSLVARVGPPRVPLFSPAPPPEPPPPEPTSPERLADAVASLRATIVETGPPTTPLASTLEISAAALIDAERIKSANSVDPKSLLEMAEWLQGVEQRLRAAMAMPPRTSGEVARDLRALLDELVASPHELTPEVVAARTDSEIELARNAPDLDTLKRHEATLLRFLRPSLATLLEP